MKMDARSKIKFVALLEAANLLNQIEQKYWVHPFHQDHERSQHMRKFYNNIREYLNTIGSVRTRENGHPKLRTAARRRTD